MAESWMDSEGLYDEDLGGGVYFDPKTGKYYAEMDYEYKGARKGFFGGRKTKTGTDFIELDESQLDEFRKYREGQEGKRYRGRRGNKGYRGPGTALHDRGRGEYQRPDGTYGSMVSVQRFEAGEALEKATMKRVKDYANWYKSETAGGERGSARMQTLEAKGQATKQMRQRYDKGRGWGSV